MRPDTSMPVRAGIVSVEVFDGELDADTIRQHYSVRNVYTNIPGGGYNPNPPGHAGQPASGGPGVTSWGSPGGAAVAGADAAGSIAEGARARRREEMPPRHAVGTPRRANGIDRGDAAIAPVAAESDMVGRMCASKTPARCPVVAPAGARATERG